MSNPLQDALGEVFRDVGIGLQEMIAERTPIDTGRAISSWNIAENQADETVTPPLRSTFKERAEPGASTLTKEQALIVMRGRRQAIGPNPKVLVVSNALDYIEGLEDGNSQQAPAGMVRRTVTNDEINLLIADSIAMRTNR